RARQSYHALDPELLLWVQATLVVTGFQAYERWVEPLDDVDREELWQDARRVGQRLGIPLDRSPADWPALQAYWAAMLAPGGPIQVTPTARRLAGRILRPPLPIVAGSVAGVLALPGLALLPAHLRAAYGIPWGPTRAAVARAADSLLHTWVSLVPASWRAMPQARAAERRARRSGTATIPSHRT
ncbi:MAG: oxygenase MpaB family protein, partial [Candidatus Limnocylindrales bacterium]